MGSSLLCDLVLFEIPVIKKWRTERIVNKARKASRDREENLQDSPSSGYYGIKVKPVNREQTEEVISKLPEYTIGEVDEKLLYKFQRNLTDEELGYVNKEFEERNIHGWGFYPI